MGPLELFVAACAVFVGAAVWGSIGFGFAFVVIPVLTLFDPTLLPPLIWLLGSPFAFVLMRRERGQADRSAATHIVGGKLVGTPIGVWLLAVIPSNSLAVFFAAALLLATGLTAVHRSPPKPASRPAYLSVGLVSGVMGTAAALGGPPLPLVLRGLKPPSFRATLAICFFVGDFLSLLGLWLYGLVGMRHVGIALALAPAMAIGYLASNRIVRRVDDRTLRLSVLVFAFISSIYVLINAV